MLIQDMYNKKFYLLDTGKRRKHEGHRPKKNLLAEDDPRDIGLTLIAPGKFNLANKAAVARDRLEAPDYPYCREKIFADRIRRNPVLILLEPKKPRVDGLEALHQIKGDPA